MKQGIAVMKDVMHVPIGYFNLFSLTKMTKAGWALRANKAKLWLTKDGMTSTCDIIIPTPSKGVLNAMYMHFKIQIL